MSDKKNILITKLLSKEIIEKNKLSIDILDFYLKVSDIVTRTHIAMGKKASFKISTSVTTNEKLNTDVFASTY